MIVDVLNDLCNNIGITANIIGSFHNTVMLNNIRKQLTDNADPLQLRHRFVHIKQRLDLRIERFIILRIQKPIRQAFLGIQGVHITQILGANMEEENLCFAVDLIAVIFQSVDDGNLPIGQVALLIGNGHANLSLDYTVNLNISVEMQIVTATDILLCGKSVCLVPQDLISTFVFIYHANTS